MQEINHPANPFPGLRPFESTETHLFFGRDGQSEELLRRLKKTRFLAVVGTSGSGKSSLVRAGLLPALQGGLMASAGSDWRIAILRPGSDPIGNLARALTAPSVLGLHDDEKNSDMQAVLAETTLRRSSLGLAELVSRARTKLDDEGQPLFPDYENLLVVVDQFEELFRFKQLIEAENSKEDAAAFVKLLLEAVRQKDEKIYVVLTMRSDFLGDCAQFWELPEAINNGQYLIPRMTRDERREAIIGPVAVGEGAISEPLVNQLLNDVGDNPDQLPILQHALMRTWSYWLTKRRNGGPIDIPHYEAIGGMVSALSRHAEEAYEELNDAQKAIAEKLFKGLTEKGADNREIRRPMEVGEICELTGADEAEVIKVIEVFRREGRSFLMPPPKDALTGKPLHLNKDSLIDISHESLIRNWERLKKWVDEESQSARIYKRLAETATLCKAGQEALLKEPALQVALDWREKGKPNEVWARRYHPEFETALTFLDESVAARNAEIKERERQGKREASYKRSRLILIVLGVAFTLSVAALTYANSQLSEAKAELSRAERERSGAERARHASEAALSRAESERLQATEQANTALKLKRDAQAQAKMAEQESEKAKAAQKVAVAEKHKAEQAKAEAIQQAAIARQREGEAKIAKAKALEAEKRSSDRLYAADINLAQQVYESSNIERVRELLEGTKKPDRGFEWYYLSHLLVAEKSSLDAPADGLVSSVTSPDGKLLAIGAGNKVEILEAGAGEKTPATIPLPDYFSIGSMAFSPNSKILAVGKASAAAEPTIRLYNTQTLKEIRSFREDREAANYMVFTPDGKLIVGGGDGSIGLWDITSSPNSPRELEVFQAQGTVFLDISRDGKMLAAGSRNYEKNTFPVLLWDMSVKEKVAKELLGHGGTISSVAFAPDGKTLATGSMDKTVRIWDTENQRPLHVLSFNSRVFSLAFAPPDGRFLAIGYEDGSIKLCDVENDFACIPIIGHHHPVTSLSFSADSKLLFSNDNKIYSAPNDDELLFEESEETRIKSWDFSTLIREQNFVSIPKGKSSPTAPQALYSPDGKTLAIVRDDSGNAAILNTETNERRSEFTFKIREKMRAYAVVFSPERYLVAADNDKKTLKFWDASAKRPTGEPLKFEDSVSKLDLSPDGRLLAVSLHNGALKVLSTTSWRAVFDLPGDKTHPVLNVFFLTDGKSIAFYRSGLVEFWDMKSNTQVWNLKVRPRELNNNKELNRHWIDLSPDGRILAASFSDGTVVLYDTDKRTESVVLKVQAEDDFPLAFSPNGKTLATGGGSGMTKLWDMASFRELVTLKGGRPYPISSVIFSPDGTMLATIDKQNRLRVWHAPKDAGVASETNAPGESR